MNKCPLCSKDAIKLPFDFKNSVTSDGKFIEKNISYSYCSSCDYIFIDQDKRLNIDEFYKNEYDFLLENDEIEPEINGVKYSDYLVGVFSKYIINTNGRLLDIGAGKGNLLSSFHDKYNEIEYYAVEPSNSFHKLKEKKFIKEKYNIFFSRETFNNLFFDYITLIEVLEHVPNPKTFLLEIKKIMNKDSMLLIEVPNFKNNKSDLLTIDHLSLFHEYNLSKLLSECGFEIVEKNIDNRVPMQFIVRLGDDDFNINKNTSLDLFYLAVNYIDGIIDDAKIINKFPIAIYGQNGVLAYLLGNSYLDIENIKCIINDGAIYQGERKYNQKVDVVSYEKFELYYIDIKNILLCMNDCYHDLVMEKIKDKNIYGLKNRYTDKNINISNKVNIN